MKTLVQRYLDRQTALPIVILQLKNALLIRFGIVSSLALFFGIIVFIILFKELGIDDHVVRLLLLVSPLSLIVFSFVASYLFSIHKIIRDVSRLKRISFSFYGGLAGVALAFWFLSEHYHFDLLLLFDGGAIFAGFLHGFARTACLNYGCCHGKEIPRFSQNRLHIAYANPHAKAVRVSNLAHKPLYPVQLYEAAGCLLVGCILVLLSHLCHYRGLLAGTYILLYGIVRFACEFFRGENDYARFMKLTIFQWISIALIAGGAVRIAASLIEGSEAEILFHAQTLESLPDFIPFIVGMPLVMFFAYGFHYRKIGQWMGTKAP